MAGSIEEQQAIERSLQTLEPWLDNWMRRRRLGNAQRKSFQYENYNQANQKEQQ